MTRFNFSAHRRLCSVAGTLVVLFASSAAASPPNEFALRSAALPSLVDPPPALPSAPLVPPQQVPLLWNGGFPGIAPSAASSVGSEIALPPFAARQLALLWSSWISVGRFTGMSFPEWVIASGGSGLFQQRVLVGFARPK